MLPRGNTEWHLACTRLLRQFISICQAVAFAHEKGVLHRDLKPLNVMLGEFGETLVLDWGLAKQFDVPDDQELAATEDKPVGLADPNASDDERTIIYPFAANSHGGGSKVEGGSAGSQTMMGQIMGTPAYMPPEQAQGLIDQLNALSNIYSLGGILYKLLTNLPPIASGKAHVMLKKVIAGDIKPPRVIDPSIPPPLEAICRKTMSLRPAERYATAVILAADVEAWLADEPVSVYADPWYHRVRRWAKRHRAAVLSCSAALLMVIVGTGLWTSLEARRIESLRRAAQVRVEDARTATEQSDLTKANLLLTEALGQVRAETGSALRSNSERRRQRRPLVGTADHDRSVWKPIRHSAPSVGARSA